jgi:hypothetical protein
MEGKQTKMKHQSSIFSLSEIFWDLRVCNKAKTPQTRAQKLQNFKKKLPAGFSHSGNFFKKVLILNFRAVEFRQLFGYTTAN